MNDPVLSVIRNRVLDLSTGQAIPGQSAQPDDPMKLLLAEIHRRHAGAAGVNALGHAPGVAAILVYGSYLRGKRDTLLDFYVLLDDFSNMPKSWHAYTAHILAPNVYNICVGKIPDQARAKYAALSLRQFEKAMTGQFHSYFWARFAQPCGLVFVKDEQTTLRVLTALRDSVCTFFKRVLPLTVNPFSSQDFWELGLSQTYRCELRAESSQQAKKLSEANAEYFLQLTQAVAQGTPLLENYAPNDSVIKTSSSQFEASIARRERQIAGFSWALRRFQGKFLSVARLLKAATTFEDALEYLLWKIQRHSGVYFPPTDRQLRYPLIFAWPLLWRLYRHGAFK